MKYKVCNHSNQLIVVLSKKQLKEVLCFIVTHGDKKANVSMAYQEWKNNASHKSISALFYVLFLCDLKNEKIEEAPKSGKK